MINIPTNIKLVIWDLDGTLINSFKVLTEKVAELAQRFGVKPPSQELLLLNFHGSLKETLDAIFADSLSRNQINELYDLFLKEQHTKYEDAESHLMEDSLRLSKSLTKKGIKQAIVTNRLHRGRGFASPRSIVERSSLKDHIEHIICGDETEVHKPNKEVLGTLLNELHIQPTELLVIGDQHVDAQLALNLNCKAIIVERPGHEFAAHHLQDSGWEEHISVVATLDDVNV